MVRNLISRPVADRGKLVLHFGPDISESGGMGKVITGYCHGDLGPWSAEAFSTYSHRSRSAMLRRLLASLLEVSVRPRRRTAGLHVHVSERFDLFRNGLIVALARARGIPVIATIHGAHFVESAERWPFVTRALLRRASIVTVLSSEAGKVAEALGGRHVVLVPNSVTVRPLPEAAAASNGSRQVLFASEIGRRKGVDVLLQAWPRIRAAQPDAELLLMGPVADPSLVKALPEGVRLCGPRKRDEVLAAIDRSSVAILPSRAEAMPLFILESMAAAVPVVTTPVGGVSELVGDAVRLVPVDDVRATADAVIELLEQPDRSRELGRRGRDLVKRAYSDEVVFQQLRSLYDQAFAPPPRALVSSEV